MISSGKAREVAEKWVLDMHGSHIALIPESIHEDDDYFGFYYQLKAALDSADFLDGMIGQGFVILNKVDGRFFEYGSALSNEEALSEHRRDDAQESVVRQQLPDYDRRDPYKLVLPRVDRTVRLVEIMSAGNLSYIVPEVESGAIWRIPKAYDRHTLQERLDAPVPLEFTNAGYGVQLELLYGLVVANKRESICDILIERYRKVQRSKDPSSATEEDLAPEW
jgi:hypothetical protein